MNMNILFYRLFILVYILIAFLFFIYHEDFYYGDAINYLGADSKLYIEFSKSVETLIELVNIIPRNKNLVGQLFYYDIILLESRLLFFVVTLGVFLFALRELFYNLKNQKYKLHILFLLLINPIIVSSFSGPNKEITSVISVLFIINYVFNKKSLYIILALIFAFFTRIELVIVILGFIFVMQFSKKNQFRIMIALLFILSSVIFYKTDYVENLKIYQSVNNSVGIVSLIAELNQNGLYFITFFPKLMINFFGEVVKLNPFLLEGESLFLYISQGIFLFISIGLVYRYKSVWFNPLVVFAILYCLVFNSPSFIQHRYFIGLYPIMVILLLYRIKDIYFVTKFNYKYIIISFIAIFLMVAPFRIIEKNYIAFRESKITERSKMLHPGIYLYIPKVDKIIEYKIKDVVSYYHINIPESWYINNNLPELWNKEKYLEVKYNIDFTKISELMNKYGEKWKEQLLPISLIKEIIKTSDILILDDQDKFKLKLLPDKLSFKYVSLIEINLIAKRDNNENIN